MHPAGRIHFKKPIQSQKSLNFLEFLSSHAAEVCPQNLVASSRLSLMQMPKRFQSRSNPAHISCSQSPHTFKVPLSNPSSEPEPEKHKTQTSKNEALTRSAFSDDQVSFSVVVTSSSGKAAMPVWPGPACHVAINCPFRLSERCW